MTEQEFNNTILPLAKNIYSFALNLTRNPSDSADITQEVMLKLWAKRNELAKVENHKAWAFKITRNLVLDQLKKQQPIYGESKMLQGEMANETDVLQSIENRTTAEAVRLIIDSLPENQREVMILREMEELEYDEISKITGLGLNHIRVLLCRGRSKVKEILVKKYHVSRYEV